MLSRSQVRWRRPLPKTIISHFNGIRVWRRRLHRNRQGDVFGAGAKYFWPGSRYLFAFRLRINYA